MRGGLEGNPNGKSRKYFAEVVGDGREADVEVVVTQQVRKCRCESAVQTSER